MSVKIKTILFVTALTFCFFQGSSHISAAGETSARKVVIAVGQEPGTTDQILAAVGGDYYAVENYGEFLISWAQNGDLVPGLATSWKVSSDGKQIEFMLRKGVKFHSGDLFTAKDVEFSYARAVEKNPTRRARLRALERIEIVDDYRVRMHFKTPDVTFLPERGICPIASKSYYDKVGEDVFVRKPVGTGPYKFASYLPGQYIDLELFDGYWGKKPSLKEARFLFVPEDTTRAAKLKVGEVDMITGLPYSMIKDVEKDPGLKLMKVAKNHPTPSVVFSNRNPKTPWHDRRVRLAMAYAIDRQTMLKTVLMGIPNFWPFLAPGELGYDPNLKHYPYDPKKAKELLAEAGYPKGFDLKFYWAITGRWPMARETAEAIASYFHAVGIRTKLVGQEWVTHLAMVRASKGADAEFVGIWGGSAGSSDPTFAFETFFYSEGGMSVYYNPEFDKVFLEAKSTMDDTRRGELIKKAVKMLHEDVASIPLYNTVAIYAMKKNIDFVPPFKTNFEILFLKDITVK